MWTKCYRLVLVLYLSIVVTCDDAAKLSNFNANLREYSGNEVTQASDVKTLQTEELGRHAYYPVNKHTVSFKANQDNAIASSGHIKNYTPRNKAEYTLHEYEEPSPYGYGPEFYAHDLTHHGGGYYGHRYHGFHGVDYHHKHIGYGIEKAILLPLAGLALLGAAAALVTNPVLLQLGVISGKRRRRDTEENTSLDLEIPSFSNEDAPEPKLALLEKTGRKYLKKELKKHSIGKKKRDVLNSLNESQLKRKYDLDNYNFVPIP